MIRSYLVEGQQVTVTWGHRQHPPVYTILIAGEPTPGSVEKTPIGKFRAIDRHGRSLGTFLGLRAAVQHVVRAEQR
jgi:hypothetical protein